MKIKNVIIIENEKLFRELLERRLQYLGYKIIHKKNLSQIKTIVIEKEIHLLIINLSFDKRKVPKLIEEIRKEKENIPIITIANEYNIEDEIAAYQSGTNIYHKKPLNYELFFTQVAALLDSAYGTRITQIGILTLDPTTRTASIRDKRTKLSKKEFALLLELSEVSGSILSREKLTNRISNENKDIMPGTIDTLISRIRTKLREVSDKEIIETIHGEGYRIKTGSLKPST